jgi:hypothetical protein
MDLVESPFFGQAPPSDCQDNTQAVVFRPSSERNHASGFVRIPDEKPAAHKEVTPRKLRERIWMM